MLERLATPASPRTQTVVGADRGGCVTKVEIGGARTTRVAWTSLAIVCLIGLLNYVDRMVLAAVTPLIKTEYRLSDTQIGMLAASFALLYSVCGVPLGRLSDRYSRRVIIASTATFWSIMTAACGATT